MKRILVADTGMQCVEVWGGEQLTEFRVVGGTHAWWHRERFLTGQAWDAIAAAALLRPAGPPPRLLMLGLGGGTSLRVLRHLIPEIQITAVELDEGMIALARRFMDLDALGIKIAIGDAYTWLETHRSRFDVVIDDVYAATDSDVTRPDWSARHLQLLRDHVKPDGVVVANLITGRGHRRMQTVVRRSFRRAFPVVRKVSTPWSWNEILVGGERVAPGKRLSEWEGDFPHRKDRKYWRALEVKKL